MPKDKNGNTPLHLVAAGFNFNPEVTKALLAKGADPNAKNEDGKTPLYYAEQKN